MRRALAAAVLLLTLLAAACGDNEGGPVTIDVSSTDGLDTNASLNILRRCKHGHPDDALRTAEKVQPLAPFCERRRKTNIAQARSAVKNALIAVEAYRTDKGTYEGMSIESLRGYDAGLNVTVGVTTATSYCIQGVVGEAWIRKPGPDAPLERGLCDGAPIVDVEAIPGDVPNTGSTAKAKANIRSATAALEAYREAYGTYFGATSKNLRADWDPGVRKVYILDTSTTSYCMEATVGAITVHKRGPDGRIKVGTCN